MDAAPAPSALGMVWRTGRRGLGALIDFMLPHRCAGCGEIVESDGGFCAPCWTGLEFLAGSACARCDLPLPSAQGDGALCGGCIADPPPYARVHVPLAYGEATRKLVLRLKYGRRTGTARLMAGLMAGKLAAAGEADGGGPLLVPVPLHRWRIWSRGFNQSAELAKVIGQRTGHVLAVDAMVRTRATASMRGLGRKARARSVRGAFAVRPEAKALLAGRTILLIDDVFTTGATVAACSRALLRAGAERVEVVAFARVIDSADRGSAIDSPGPAADI